MNEIDKTKTNPGRHKLFDTSRFGEEEQRILGKLRNEWYLTNSGAHIQLATSAYDYFLMKPTD